MELVRFKQRDRNSVEIKTKYKIDRSAGVTNSYTLRFYLFFPNAFGINPGTYDQRSFLRQLRAYLRFDTPRFTIDELLDPLSDWSPLVRLQKIVRTDRIVGDEIDRNRFIYESKLLGCVYKSLLRDYTHKMNDSPGLVDDGTIKKIHDVVRRFRRTRDDLAQRDPDAALMQHADMIDEHLSLLLSRYLVLLLHERDQNEEESVGSKRIAKTVQKEEQYRQSRKYPSVSSLIRSERQFEEYVYREKMLKKYATEALFFEVSRTNTAKRTEHILYAIAAGIAMFVATGIAFIGQQRYGSLTTSLFVLLVVGYMVKDRVKDLFRDILTRSMGSFFTVRKIVIRDRKQSRRHRRIAVLHERIGFRHEAQLPEAVVEARNRGHFERVLFASEYEYTLLYAKKIRLNSRTIAALHNRVDAVADINVLDLRPFLQNLGAQYGVVPLDEGKRQLRPRVVKRVYHLNMILEYESSSGTTVQRYRLIVDGQGIKRIESVGDTGTVEHGTWALADEIGDLDDDDR